jgi:TolB protein
MNARRPVVVVAYAIAVLFIGADLTCLAAEPQRGNEQDGEKLERAKSKGNLAETAAASQTSPDIDLNPRVFVGDPDGSNMKLLLDLPEYDIQGMPSWSSDGKRIVLEAWRSSLGEINDNSKVIVINADGSHPQILGDGGMPSFSPQGDRLAFRRVDPNKGIWVMSSEGPEKDLIPIAADGWNPRWSPAGETLVYITYGDSPNLVVFDLTHKTRTPLFEQTTCPYSSFLWNVAWSPDGRRIAFKGRRIKDGKWELGLVDARGASFGVITRLPTEVWGITWCGDCNRIFFGMWTPANGGGVQLFSLSPDKNDPPRALPGHDPTRRNSLLVHSPDGKKMLMVSAKVPPKTE